MLTFALDCYDHDTQISHEGTMNRITYGIKIRATLGFGLIVLALFGCGQHKNTPPPFDKQAFDRSVWISYDRTMDRNSLRGQMADSVKNKLLASRPTKAEVIELLGQPDMPSTYTALSYHLGMWSQNRGKTDSLDVHFGADDHVREVQYSQHEEL